MSPRHLAGVGVAAIAIALTSPGAALGVVDESTGALDRTFSRDGFVRTAFGDAAAAESARDVAAAVTVRADGRIVVAGQALDGSLHFALARYRRNGAPDTEFMAPAGFRALDVSPRDGGDDAIADLATQPDGMLLAAGYATPSEGSHDIAVVRLDAEGELDPDFGVGGVAITPAVPGNVLAEDRATALALQPDGRIVVAGSTTGVGGDDAVLARLNPNGTPDQTFSGDGLLRIDLSPGGGDRFADVEVGAGGAITAVGTAERLDDPGQPDVAVARFRADGSPDPSLAGDGTALVDPAANADVATSLALRPGGAMLVGGTTSGPGFCDAPSVLSLTATGALDGAFGRGGVAYADVSGGCGEEANALAVQGNGKLLLGGGNAAGEFALMRFTSRGELDPALGGDGVVIRPVDVAGAGAGGRESAIVDLAIGRAGSVVVVGSSRVGGDATAWTVARFSNPCALAAARLRSTATRFGKAETRLKRAGKSRQRSRLRREAKRAKARMKSALRAAKRACDA